MSQSFDPQELGRYAVFRVHYQYRDQPPGEKLFIALKHESHPSGNFCWCLKTTSKIQRYDQSADGRRSYLIFEAGKLTFFPRETVIDPSNFIPLLHNTLEREAKRGRYCIEGKMPESFHGDLADVIRACKTLEPKKKVVLLSAIGEKF